VSRASSPNAVFLAPDVSAAPAPSPAIVLSAPVRAEISGITQAAVVPDPTVTLPAIFTVLFVESTRRVFFWLSVPTPVKVA